MSKRLVVIIDIDTTIADNEHRVAMLVKHCVICGDRKGSPPHAHCNTCMMQTDDKITQDSWDTFLRPDIVALDEPHAHAQAVIKQWRKSGLEFHFLTGRNDGLREVTEEWLKKYFDYDSSKEALVMRSNDTHGEWPASKYKEWAFKNLVKERGLEDCIFLFCEDDPWCFGMFSKYGMCLRCPEGWEHFMPVGKNGEGHWQRR